MMLFAVNAVNRSKPNWPTSDVSDVTHQLVDENQAIKEDWEAVMSQLGLTEASMGDRPPLDSDDIDYQPALQQLLKQDPEYCEVIANEEKVAAENDRKQGEVAALLAGMVDSDKRGADKQ